MPQHLPSRNWDGDDLVLSGMIPAPIKSTPERSGRAVVAAFVVMVAGVTLYFALGMPGMDHGTSSSIVGMDMNTATSPHRLVGPEEFETALTDRSATVINVHVPYEGEIEGTDLFMPFDALDPAQLPSDRASKLLVYCRSGKMSGIASITLVDLGYINVIELGGGMQAWTSSGRSLVGKT